MLSQAWDFFKPNLQLFYIKRKILQSNDNLTGILRDKLSNIKWKVTHMILLFFFWTLFEIRDETKKKNLLVKIEHF